MLFVFVISAALLGYTFVGYPALMRLLATTRRKGAVPDGFTPTITIVVAAHNAADLIAGRLENLRACDYPADRLDIIVASDGSTDNTVEAIAHQGVSVLDFPNRRGKPACLNDAVAQARGELVVFADARQRFEPDALRRLAAPFADPVIGAVSGALSIASSDSAVGGGIGGYWKIERRLREDESATGSAIGCTGAIYAIRREVFRPIPEDTLIDDVVIPMGIAATGARIFFESRARAYDPQPLDPGHELRRKRRTIAGNFQMLFRHPLWCTPWGHPLWWRLISHKYLRLIAPALLLICFCANVQLAFGNPYFVLPLACQIGFFALAVAGMLWRGEPRRALALPAAFVFLNAMTVRGARHYFAAGRKPGW